MLSDNMAVNERENVDHGLGNGLDHAASWVGGGPVLGQVVAAIIVH